ncbi:MAG: shikimate kinase [Anaerolineales bacterium]
MPVVGRTPYRNLILTGTTGVGKTGIGRRLAARMAGANFIDLEVEIQERQGYTADQIRETFGQARLLSLESDLVEEMTLHRSSIIAVRGTTLLEPLNLEKLRETGPALCLTADLGELLRRLHVSQGGRFHNPDVRAQIVGLLKRESAVTALDIPQIDTTGVDIEDITAQAQTFWLTESDI